MGNDMSCWGDRHAHKKSSKDQPINTDIQYNDFMMMNLMAGKEQILSKEDAVNFDNVVCALPQDGLNLQNLHNIQL